MAKDYVDELEDAFVIKYANSYTIDQLREIRDKLTIQNADTSIIDKAINLKLKRKVIERENKYKEEKKLRKAYKKAFWAGLFSGLFGSSNKTKKITDWETQELLNNKDYESYNFEEDEIEEDDFYSDDLD